MHVWSGYCGAVSDGLGGIFVGDRRCVVFPVYLSADSSATRVNKLAAAFGSPLALPTFKKASLTRGSVISSLRQRFSTRSRFEAPELRHAMVAAPVTGRVGFRRLAERGVGIATSNRRRRCRNEDSVDPRPGPSGIPIPSVYIFSRSVSAGPQIASLRRGVVGTEGISCPSPPMMSGPRDTPHRPTRWETSRDTSGDSLTEAESFVYKPLGPEVVGANRLPGSHLAAPKD